MFSKKVKLTEQELQQNIKELQDGIRGVLEAEYSKVIDKYSSLKIEFDKLQQSFGKTLQENDILKAKLIELEGSKKVDETKTVDKYNDLANKLFSDG